MSTARARRRSGLRVAVGTAAAVSGIALGLVVAGLLNTSDEPAPYRPFFAGLVADRVEDIREDGPVLIPDPRGGDRAFYLDLDEGEIVALHVVPPGGSTDCLVQFDRETSRYEDCQGQPVERASLARFEVLTPVNDDDEEAVFVDLREVLPPPGGRPPAPPLIGESPLHLTGAIVTRRRSAGLPSEGHSSPG